MIDTQRCNPACCKALRLKHIGRIEPSAKANFHDASIGWNARKLQKCRSDRDLEETAIQPFGCVKDFFKQGSKPVICDQFARDPKPLVIAHKMGAGGDMNAITLGFKHGA